MPEVVVVDHHDSYTWNLVHLLAGVTGRLPKVVQHDETTLEALTRFTHVVLSPGPGHPGDPADFAIGTALLRAAARPVLGVCLGMQGLVTSYGGTVERVVPAHGEVARLRHDESGVFAGIPQGIEVVRYHSLAAVALPAELVATAWAEDGTVMGVRHRTLPLEGVQFHPESVLSTYGAQMVATFLDRS